MFLSPHPLNPPSPPYPFHGIVPQLGEVFLGTIVVLDGRHYHKCQEFLSLGGAGQCWTGREGGHVQATTHSQGFANLPPSPIPVPHHCGIHQGNHSSCNLSNKDEEENEEELSGEQGSEF